MLAKSKPIPSNKPPTTKTKMLKRKKTKSAGEERKRRKRCPASVVEDEVAHDETEAAFFEALASEQKTLLSSPTRSPSSPSPSLEDRDNEDDDDWLQSINTDINACGGVDTDRTTIRSIVPCKNKKCVSPDVSHREMQLRSGDEGASILFVCRTCKTQWQVM